MGVMAGSPQDKRWGGTAQAVKIDKKKEPEKETIVVYEDNPEIIKENKGLKGENENLQRENKKANIALAEAKSEIESLKEKLKKIDDVTEEHKSAKKVEKKSNVPKSSRSRKA